MYERVMVRLFVAMFRLFDVVDGRGTDDEVAPEVATDACCFGVGRRGRNGKHDGTKAQEHFHVRFRPFGQPDH
jgi:hypothetical protein